MSILLNYLYHYIHVLAFIFRFQKKQNIKIVVVIYKLAKLHLINNNHTYPGPKNDLSFLNSSVKNINECLTPTCSLHIIS